jgi:hypothetical protein
MAALAAGERPDGPPAGAEPLLVVRGKGDAAGYLGYVGALGECYDGDGALLGRVDADSLECGDAHDAYLGRVEANAMGGDDLVLDADDDIVAVLDKGLGAIKDATGASTLAELSRRGACATNAGDEVADFDGFHYGYLPVVALYVLFVRPGLLEGTAEDAEHLALSAADLAALAADAKTARDAADAADAAS